MTRCVPPRSLRRLVPTLVAGAVLAACVLVTASAQAEAGPKYGGTLVFGIQSGDPDTLDPTVSQGSGIQI